MSPHSCTVGAALVCLLAACGPGEMGRSLPLLPALPERVEVLAPVVGEERPLREVIIALTGAVRGEVEVCGCPTSPYGGFARRSSLYSRLEAGGVPLMRVDAGEMLVKGLTARDEVDRKVRADAVLSLARPAGLDAWAASPVDLLPGGLAFLRSEGAISANWDPADAPMAAATIVERGGVRVGFIGLAAPAAGVPTLAAIDSVNAAKSSDADAWFVLSNADDATNVAVAEGVPGLAAVLATGGEAVDEPRATAGAPIIETPGRGRYVTLIHLFLGSTPRALEVVTRGIWKDVATFRSGRSLGTAPTSVALAVEASRDHERLVRRTRGRGLAFVETLPLGANLDGDTRTQAQLAMFHSAILGSARAAVATPLREGYATGSACGACHQDRLASWAFDGHARAVESLASRQSTENPECVGCHTTGFGRPGGFSEVSVGASSAFRDVQCEACHGPMAGHDGRGSVHSTPVTEATCRGCHDEANSPAFDYASYLKRISCSRVAAQGRPDAP